MIDFDVGPRIAVVLPLLQIERVEFVGLRRRAGHQSIKHCRVAFDSRAKRWFEGVAWWSGMEIN